MRFLLEKSLLPISKVKTLQGLPSDQRKQQLKILTQNRSIFPNQDQLKQYNGVWFINLIDEKGLDTTQNPFLLFAVNNPDSNKVTISQAKLLNNLMQSGDIHLQGYSRATKWIFNPKAYNSTDYKIKALAFLSNTNKAAAYGDPKTLPIDQILAETDEAAIKNILQNWQTKDGNDRDSSRRSKKSSNKKPTTSKEQQAANKLKREVENLVNPLLSKSKDEVAKLIDNNYVVGDTIESLVSKVIKAAGKEQK